MGLLLTLSKRLFMQVSLGTTLRSPKLKQVISRTKNEGHLENVVVKIPRSRQALIRLTLYHTITTFNNPIEKGFGKHCGNPHFLLFPVSSTLSKREIIILAMLNLSSANAINLDGHIKIFVVW